MCKDIMAGCLQTGSSFGVSASAVVFPTGFSYLQDKQHFRKNWQNNSTYRSVVCGQSSMHCPECVAV